MPGQTFAYLRVSKLDQDLEKNKADILKLANEAHMGHVQFIEEKLSGKISWRKRQIATILEQAQEGDAIIVSELSRLGRSMLECMEILSLALQKGIRVYAVKGNWQLNNSIQNKIVAMAFQVEIVALLKNGATKTWIAQKYGTTRRNLSHWMKQHRIV